MASDTLRINSDGTYEHHYGFGVNGFVKSGTWEFEVLDGIPRITFSKCRFGMPGYGTAVPGFWDVEVKKSFGQIRLEIDPDLNYYYAKQ